MYIYTYRTYKYNGKNISYEDINHLVDVLMHYKHELKQIRLIEKELMEQGIIGDTLLLK